MTVSPGFGEPRRVPAHDDGRDVRGITISTHGSGRDWAREEPMRRTMGDLVEVGANWVTIHPYAAIRNDGTVATRWSGDAGPPEHVTTPIRLAREAGLRILIKPHLAYWGSRFAWRGEIRFDDPADWDRFWTTYTRWIVDLARHSGGADAFAIGTELDATLDHGDSWDRLIAAVRREFDGRLTYAANWTDFERVPFWSRLDAIGIQGYFPLAEQPAAGDAEIRSGWRTLRRRLADYSDRHGKPIVLTELGYNRSDDAPVRPWDYAVGGASAASTQERCLRIALEEIAAEPSIAGAFLWKWFPEPRPVGRTFQLATPELREIIRNAWTRAPLEPAARP